MVPLEVGEEICPRCKSRRASTRATKFCWKCHEATKQTGVPIESVQSVAKITLPAEFVAKAAVAKTTEDWQKLAAELAPVVVDILNGTVKATAAQASLIKDIMDRAFGRPTATQLEKRVAAGVIILPTLNTDSTMTFTCPKCGYDPKATLVS